MQAHPDENSYPLYLWGLVFFFKKKEKDVFIQRTLAIIQAKSKQRLPKRVLQNVVTSSLYSSNELANQYTNTPNNQRANCYNQDILYI